MPALQRMHPESVPCTSLSFTALDGLLGPRHDPFFFFVSAADARPWLLGRAPHGVFGRLQEKDMLEVEHLLIILLDAKRSISEY